MAGIGSTSPALSAVRRKEGHRDLGPQTVVTAMNAVATIAPERDDQPPEDRREQGADCRTASDGEQAGSGPAGVMAERAASGTPMSA